MNIEFMQTAISLAKRSGKDIPVGAVIVREGEIIAQSFNEKEKSKNPVKHAEIIAIEKACEKLKNWRLNGCEMYVTLEPCPMCSWALIQSRISKVYFGAYDNLYGALGSKIDLRTLLDSNLKVKGGILEDECNNIIKTYFEALR